MVDQSTEAAIDSVVRQSLARLSETASLDDFEKAIGIAKSAADARKSNTDAQYQTRQLRLETVKSWSAMLVPIVSLFALFGTIYFQSIQLRATREQSEDTQWRELLNSLRRSPNVISSDITVAPRLRSFFASPRYGKQAHEFARLFMGHISSFSGFKDIYFATFAAVDENNIEAIAKLLRAIYNTKHEIQAACEAAPESAGLDKKHKGFGGICDTTLSESDVSRTIRSSAKAENILQMREAYSANIDQLYFLSQAVAVFLKENYKFGSVRKSHIDLTNSYLVSVDLSDIDFSLIDIAGTIFNNVELKGTHLHSERFTGVEFWGSNWWDARSINQKLLEDNILRQYPFYQDIVYFYGEPPTEQHYKSRISALCVPPMDYCKNPVFKYTTK